MTLEQRISSFASLGQVLRTYTNSCDPKSLDPTIWEMSRNLIEKAIREAEIENPWFTCGHILQMLYSWGVNLTEERLVDWLDPYREGILNYGDGKRIGVVMAGNIPMVGFHDLLSVLMTNHTLVARISSQDSILIPALMNCLMLLESDWKDKIHLVTGEIRNIDAVIATGSGNTSRYFERYFGKHPNIIRKNRSGVAVLTGRESQEDLENLANDLFIYFGLGCRSVSKLYIPKDYDFTPLHKALLTYQEFFDHVKYRNNLDYYKSLYLVNRTPFLDGGFYLLIEHEQLAAPVSVIHYEYYKDISSVTRSLTQHQDLIQCIVSLDPGVEGAISTGGTQNPALSDYADGIDTLRFLLEKI